jgi:ribosomal protein S18 acetylase RimI-like enzyme
MENFIVASGAWSRASGGTTWDYPGIHCFASTVPRRAFNQAIITGPASDNDLRHAIQRFDETGLRYRVRMRDTIDLDLKPRLECNGLVYRGGLPAMAFDGDLPQDRPTTLAVEEVRDARRLGHHVAVVADAFEWEAEQLGQVFRPRLLDEPGWYGWVGYDNGEPVAASQLVTHNGTGGLYYVAVTGTHRRKGYGEAITRVAIEAARSRGCSLVTLTASSHGYPVYERLGFRDAGTHVGYTTPDADD